MNMNSETRDQNRVAAINGLAIVGFIALVAGGMWLAVYTAQYVPAAISRLGAAAVTFTQIFNPAPNPGLSVVENATTTIPFGNATTTTATSTTAATTTKPSTGATTPAQPVAGTPTSGTYPIGTGPATPGNLYGLPDLTVVITSVGYLNTSDASSFVAASKVPSGKRPAVKFTVRNAGTNVTSSWRFTAEIPTKRDYTFRSPTQQALNPGESIDYTLGFDQADRGDNQKITIEVNSDESFKESNTGNNTISATLTVL